METESIMERVKTFDDAINVLGEDHPLVKEYRSLNKVARDHLAYSKLCIITAALNEGWEPQFTKGEYCFYPYFYFYTKKEIKQMINNKRDNLISIKNGMYAFRGAVAVLTVEYSCYIPSNAYAVVNSQLCFKTRELALFAGKQFIKLYYDFYMK